MQASSNSPSKRRSSFAFLKGKSSPSKTETSPVIDKITTKALASALLDGDEVKALAAYTAVDKTTGISLDVELHPSLPLSGLAGNDAGHTPLHLAAAGCMQNILASFLEHGGSPNTLNALNQTSLHAACGGLRVDRTDGLVGRALQSLWGRVVRRGSSSSSNSPASGSLGDSARARARAECVGRLLAWRGLEIDGDSERTAVNAVDRFGNTALHYACSLHSNSSNSSSSRKAASGEATGGEVAGRHQEAEVVVQQLLGRGALLTLVNGEGETAVDCAGRAASYGGIQTRGDEAKLQQPSSRLRRLSLSPRKRNDAAISGSVDGSGVGTDDGSTSSAESAAAAAAAGAAAAGEALVDALEALVVFAVDLREQDLRLNLLQELHEQQMQHSNNSSSSGSASASSSGLKGSTTSGESSSNDGALGLYSRDGWGALRTSDEVLAWARNTAASACAALKQGGLIHCTSAGAELLLVACAWSQEDLLSRLFSGGCDNSSSLKGNSTAEDDHEEDDESTSSGILEARHELLAAAGLSDPALAQAVLGPLTAPPEPSEAPARVLNGARVIVDVSSGASGEDNGDGHSSSSIPSTSEPEASGAASDGDSSNGNSGSSHEVQWMAGTVIEAVNDVVLVNVDEFGADVDVPLSRLRLLLPLTTENEPSTTSAPSTPATKDPCICAVCGDEAPMPDHSNTSSSNSSSSAAALPFLVPNDGCAHAFCADCWLGHLRVQLREGAGAEPKCAAPCCPMPVAHGVVVRALKSMDYVGVESTGEIACPNILDEVSSSTGALGSSSSSSSSTSTTNSAGSLSFQSEEAPFLYARWRDVRASSIVERASCLAFCPSNACSAAVLHVPSAITKRASSASSGTSTSRGNRGNDARQRRQRGGQSTNTATGRGNATGVEEAEEAPPVPSPAAVPALDACCLACHKAPWCWTCGSRDAHAPCPCKEWGEWAQQVREHVTAAQKALGEDASNGSSSGDGGGLESVVGGDARDMGNLLWLAANTKKCPQCKAFIEKDDGCNHMACKRCRHDFCWICMQPWREHSNKTGGYYKCNRFVEDGEGAAEGGGGGSGASAEGVNAPNDTENRGHGSAAEEARRASEEAKKAERFIHHYTRFAAQGESHKMEQARVPRALARIAHLQNLASAAAVHATNTVSTSSADSGSGSDSYGGGGGGGGSGSGSGGSSTNNGHKSLLAAMVDIVPGAAEQLRFAANESDDATKALSEAFRELGRCRLLLRNSYAFAFFAYDPARLLAAAAERHGAEYTKRRYYRAALRERLRARRSAYEALQSELEMRTETMSEIVARRFLRASVHEVQSATRAAAQYRADFLALLEEPVPLPEPSVSTVLGGHRNSNYSTSSYSAAPFGLYGFASENDVNSTHYHGNWNASLPPQGRPPRRNRIGWRSQQGWPLSADWHDAGQNENADDDGTSNGGDDSLPENEGSLQAFLEAMARQHNGPSSSSSFGLTNATSRDGGGEEEEPNKNSDSGDVGANGRETDIGTSSAGHSRSQLSRSAQALLEDNEDSHLPSNFVERQERVREQERARERRRQRHEREAAAAAEAVAKAEAQAAAVEEQEMMAQMLMMEGAFGENTMLSEEQELARAILMSLGNGSDGDGSESNNNTTIDSSSNGAEGSGKVVSMNNDSSSSSSESLAVSPSEYCAVDQRAMQAAVETPGAIRTLGESGEGIDISRDTKADASHVNLPIEETSFEAPVDVVAKGNDILAAAASTPVETVSIHAEEANADANAVQSLPPAPEVVGPIEAYPDEADYAMAVVPLRPPGSQYGSRRLDGTVSNQPLEVYEDVLSEPLPDKYRSSKPFASEELSVHASLSANLSAQELSTNVSSTLDISAEALSVQHPTLGPVSNEPSLNNSLAPYGLPTAEPPAGKPSNNEIAVDGVTAHDILYQGILYPAPASSPLEASVIDSLHRQPSTDEPMADVPSVSISSTSMPSSNDVSPADEHSASDPSANNYAKSEPSSSTAP